MVDVSVELGFGCSQTCACSHMPAWSRDGWLISLVHEGPDMRTSPAIPQAGDLLLVDAIMWHPLCHWLYLPRGLGVWQRLVEFHGERYNLSGLPLKQGAQKSWLCLKVEESGSKALVGVPMAKLTEPTLYTDCGGTSH